MERSQQEQDYLEVIWEPELDTHGPWGSCSCKHHEWNQEKEQE